MKIILCDTKEVFEENLKAHISALQNPILFDITLDSTSERILTLSDDGIYTLSFSQPIIINIFKPPLSDYEFIFSIITNEFQKSTIVGKFILKKYVIAAIILVSLIISIKVYEILFRGAPFNCFFICYADNIDFLSFN